jgi:N-formylglutamate deformylase
MSEIRVSELVSVEQGSSPLILGQPHVGTAIPPRLLDQFNDLGRSVLDTDWWIDEIYSGLLPEATIVAGRLSRYVIDLNRDPGGASLYPGQNTTALCPVVDFEGRSIYRSGLEPDEEEIERRRRNLHQPYHSIMEREIERLRARHDNVLLFDCHSIRSRLPFLFEGELPLINVGTDSGGSCDPLLEAAMVETCVAWAGEEQVAVNGRFRGGWTTRYYGRPSEGVHTVQLELAQRSYMKENPSGRHSGRANAIRELLRTLLGCLETVTAGLD